MSEETRKRAEQVMRVFAQVTENKQKLQATIANEMKAYNENLKEAEKELLEIGATHRGLFDSDGNLDLGDGYLHIANNTVILMKPKFDAKEFAKEFPHMIDMSKAMKTAEIKKACLTESTRKELKKYGVETDTEESMQVLVRKV